MRIILCLFVIIFMINGCSKKEDQILLQQQEIAIVQPRIETSSAIIDSSVVVTANLRFDGVKIYYTNDGSEPTDKSNEYLKPLIINKEGIYKFRAFHEAWKPSETVKLKLYDKGIVPKNIVWHSNINDKYNGMGNSTLINQEKASLDYRNPQWFGFDTVAVAEVFFNRKIFIKDIRIGFLVDTQSWIFPPSSVKVYVDKDTMTMLLTELEQATARKIQDLYISIGKELSSVRIEVHNLRELPDWHEGKGNKAWLFMDEWIFN